MRRPKSFTSHDIQNEILEPLAHEILRDIVKDIKKSPCFAIIADETTNCSKKKQISICLRCVNDLQPFEDFIGMFETANTTAKALSSIIQDVLIRHGVPLDNLRGQCYDGATNMAGDQKAVMYC